MADLAASNRWAIPSEERTRWFHGRVRDVLMSAWLVVFCVTTPVLRVRTNPSLSGATALLLVAVGVAAVAALTLVRRWPWGWAALVAVGLAGAISAHPSVGSAAAVVVVAAALVGHAVWVRWDPWPGHPERVGAVAILAVPVALLAMIEWRRHGSTLVTLGLLGVALVVVELTVRVPRAVDAEAGLRRGVLAIGHAIGAFVIALVVVPLLYLPAFLFRPVSWSRDRRRARAGTTWRVRTRGVIAARRDQRTPFASAERADLRAQRVLAMGLAVVLVGAIVVYRHEADPTTLRQPTDPYSGKPVGPPSDKAALTGPEEIAWSATDAGRGSSWVDQGQRDAKEMTYSTNPVGGFLLDDLKTPSINVVHHTRRTLAVGACRCTPVSVWVSGGSAAWGAGQRDDHTIASDLVRLSAKSSAPLEVTNVAQPGWTLWQEYQGVLARLSRASAPPDAVVFYTGFNDLVGRFTDVLNRQVDWNRPAMVSTDMGAIDGLAGQSAAEIDSAIAAAGGRAQVIARTATRERDLIRLIRSQLEASGIEVAFYFQGDAAASSKVFVGLNNPPLGPTDVVTPIRLRYDDFARGVVAGLGDEVVDLRRPVSDPGRIYLDFVHTNEAGALDAATSIYRDLGPVIDRITADREKPPPPPVPGG